MLLTKNYKDSTTLEITDITIVSTQIVRGSYVVAIAVVLISIIIYPYTRAPVIKVLFLFQNFKAVGDTSTTTMFDVLVHTKCCTLNRLVVCNVNQSKYVSYHTVL
jgi:hypothetical protein